MRIRARLTCVLLTAGCASGPRPGAPPDEVEGYVYARPLEEVLPEASTVLAEQGWKVQARGNQLATGWRDAGAGSLHGLRVDGERIDVDHCRIRIEAIDAVSLGPAIEDRQSRQGAVSGEVTAGSDRLESSNTLGSLPAGRVVLPRGRDAALEWAVLLRLDPRAAQALERAGAPVSATLPGSPVLPGTPGAAHPLDCGSPVAGAAQLVAGRRLVLVADVSDTHHLPGLITRLTCRAAEQGIRTVVALELLRADQELVDTYLAGQGTAADRATFLQRAHSTGMHGGGGGETVLVLLDALRGMRDAGVPLRVLLFDEPPGSAGRDRARARTLERLRRSAPDALVLVAVRPDEASPGAMLDLWGLHPAILDAHAALTPSPASPGGNHATH